jgi:hypothetical protein
MGQHFASIHNEPAALDRRAWPICAVQLQDQPWTLLVHGIGSLSWGIFEQGRQFPAALASRQGWRVLHATSNDTDGECWFTLIDGDGQTADTDPRIVKTLGIALPGFDPWHDRGLCLIGVAERDVARVDVIETG